MSKVSSKKALDDDVKDINLITSQLANTCSKSKRKTLDLSEVC